MDRKLLTDIAKMYYLEGLTQKQIGEKLNISRIGISRALKKCIETGVVEIKINEYSPLSNLENDLKKKFNGKDFKIVHYNNDYSVLLKNLAQTASIEILSLAQKYNTIGIGWGNTMSNINISTDIKYPEKTLIPLLGGYGNVSFEMHSNQIVAKLSAQLGCKSKVLLAPAVVDNKDFKNIIINEPSIKEVFDLYNSLDCVISSLGSPADDNATIHKSGYFKDEDIKALTENNICCDIVSSIFLDMKGSEIALEISDRLIGISGKSLRQVPYKVAVAGGESKMYAIYLALVGNYIDKLITDENTARYLLSK